MSLDDLLIWLSARRCGSWAQFRGAVEELHVEPDGREQYAENADDESTNDLPVYQAVRLTLQRLAHVEFYTSSTDADWRVVPPSLAVRKEGNRWLGILCGARPPDLLKRIGQSGVTWESQASMGMPDCIRLLASDLVGLEAAAKAGGLRIQFEASASILAAIPPVDDPRSRILDDAPLVPGWTIERFVPSTLRWTSRHDNKKREIEFGDVPECRTGLFRFRLKYQRFHYLRWGGRTYSVHVQVGKYAILRHRRVHGVLKYDPSRSILSVPVSCRPPLLIERALILCTGLLPGLNQVSGSLEYTVPSEIARLAAGLLRQEIEIT